MISRPIFIAKFKTRKMKEVVRKSRHEIMMSEHCEGMRALQ
jgi:hypothetical protein